MEQRQQVLGPARELHRRGVFRQRRGAAKKADPANATNRQARTPARLTRGPNQPSRDGFRTSEKTPKANSPTVPSATIIAGVGPLATNPERPENNITATKHRTPVSARPTRHESATRRKIGNAEGREPPVQSGGRRAV